MGQRNIKKTRKVVDKAVKAQAYELAKAQILDIAQAPFKIRWSFCKMILFPGKLRKQIKDRDQNKRTSYGGIISDEVAKMGGAKNAG